MAKIRLVTLMFPQLFELQRSCWVETDKWIGRVESKLGSVGPFVGFCSPFLKAFQDVSRNE